MFKKRRIDMISGPLGQNMWWYAIPIMFSGMAQLLFTTINTVVVGRFSGSIALAAVGSTSALISLLINLFLGLSLGANVVMARFYGARNYEKAKEFVSTALITAFVSGVIILFVGVFMVHPLLKMMKTPIDVLPLAALYIQIYFLGTPGNLVYNFGSALFYASGDTKRPFYFLCLSGVVNVVSNVILVIMADCKMKLSTLKA